MPIHVDLMQITHAIARAVDLVGVDDVMHGRRVGIMAVECARRMGWETEAQAQLFEAGLLHDCGVSSTRDHRHLVNELDWEGAQAHCQRGYELLRDFAPLSHLAPIILHHHTHWEDLVRLPVPAETARLANLIYLADRADAQAAQFQGDGSVLLHAAEIRDGLARFRGTFFAPEAVDAFLAASRAEAFWLLTSVDYVPQYVAEMESLARKRSIGLQQLKQFALIIARIVDAKSHFTTEHSLGVARLTRYLGALAGISGEHLDRLEVAALLHDIGKLQIPDEMLESTARLSPGERSLIKRHSFATYQILKRIGGLEEIAHWAAQHHESLDGSGYPFHDGAGAIPLEARIIKVADVFQALAQDRPYRQAMPPAEVIGMLRTMQGQNEVDSGIVDLVESRLADCHRAALGSQIAS